MPGLGFDVCGLRQLRNQGLSKVEPGFRFESRYRCTVRF